MVDTTSNRILQRPSHIISGFGTKLLKLDFYGENFRMKIDRSVESLPTWMGTFCSLLTLVIMVAFTALKLDVLLRKDDINVLVAMREYFFPDDFVFNNAQGLNVAAAIVAYSSDPEPILDPTIG